MANKGFVAIYVKQQEKYKIKKAYIIYTKRQHKKSNKIKKDVDKVNKICYYPIVTRQEKMKIEIESKIGIKMGQ